MTIVPNEFPELRFICWHKSPELPMEEREAFNLYERNWRYIDVDTMSSKEKALIKRLTATYGHGVLNV